MAYQDVIRAIIVGLLFAIAIYGVSFIIQKKPWR